MMLRMGIASLARDSFYSIDTWFFFLPTKITYEGMYLWKYRKVLTFLCLPNPEMIHDPWKLENNN